MAEKIRINVEKVELEVNDYGDIIILPVSDERFIEKLYSFANDISKKSEELNYIDKSDVSAYVKADIELHKQIKSQFDILFGVDAYKKVFGEDIVVGAEYVFEFLDQIMPYFNNHIQNRVEKLSKYSANRTGSST